VYDMYPWNDPDSGANHHQNEPAAAWLPAPRDGRRAAAAEPREVPADPAGSAIRAVQVALDRRDNGGDALAVASQPAAPQPAAPQPAAPQPAAGRTRQ
jgi:hypothetical protein